MATATQNKLPEPSGEGVARAIELIKNNPEGACYLGNQLEYYGTGRDSPYLRDMKLIVKQVINQAQQAGEASTGRNAWGGELPLGTTSYECGNKANEERYFNNISDANAKIELEFALSEDAKLIRRWSVDGQAYGSEELADADGRLRCYLTTHGIDMDTDGSLYQTNEHGRRVEDDQRNYVRVKKDTVLALIQNQDEGIVPFFQKHDRNLITTERSYVVGPQEKAKQEPVAPTGTKTQREQASSQEEQVTPRK